ncbi:MAG: hypothetical protein IJ123_03525 [Blautia sp.]|nr:hypothetical protein [Blautia sp.]
MSYVETRAETRFSDFGAKGELHFSRCLMFFEKARFAISLDAGLKEALQECYPGKGISFVVIRVNNHYIRHVPLRYDIEGGLVVRSKLLAPCTGKLSFEQELWGLDDSEGPFVKARIDTAMLLEGEGLLARPDPRIIKCLEDYYYLLERENRILS